MSWLDKLFFWRKPAQVKALPDLSRREPMWVVKTYRPQDILPASDTLREKRSTYDPTNAVNNGLAASVWVYASCSLLARACASVPWRAMYQAAPDKWEHRPESQLQKLIDQPNKQWSRNRLFQEMTYSMNLAGEAYVSKIRSKAMGTSAVLPDMGLPHELWVLPPDRLAPRAGGPNRPLIVSYVARSGDPKEVPATEIMQAMFPNPADPYHGLAPLCAAQNDVDSEVEASKWQLNTYANRAVPDGIFALKEYLDDEQWETVKESLAEEYSGASHARRPMLLGQDINWIALSRSAVELDYINSRSMTRENITAAFGVPPVLVGILDRATYSNFAQAELWLWKGTVLPTLDIYRDLFNAQLAPEFGPRWRLDYDTANVDALLPLFAERVAVAKELVSMGVPMSVVNERLNLSVEQYPGMDVGLVPATMIPVDSFAPGGTFEDM